MPMEKVRNFSETAVAQALLEMAEDRINECVVDAQDLGVVEGKPYKVTLEVTITPNASRDQFTFSTTGKKTLAPRRAAETTMFAAVKGKEVELTRYNAAQASIEDAIEAENAKTRNAG